MDSKNFDFSWLVGVIRDNLRIFVVVGIVSAIVGVVISMPAVMTPKFKSTAIVYPRNITPYSDESETEQLLQLFEASSIRDSLIEKFDLYEAYDIDPESESSRFYLLEEYRDNVRVGKTKYESVMLEVISEDPVRAKQMADEILKQVSLKYKSLVRESAKRISDALYSQILYQRQALDSIEAVISRISTENNVLEYSNQTRELVRGYVRELSEKGTAGVDEDLKKLMQNAQEKGSTVRMLQELSDKGTQQYDYLARRYLDQRVIIEGRLNYIDVIVEPEVPDKKFWPVRWLILLISVSVGIIATLVLIILFKRT